MLRFPIYIFASSLFLSASLGLNNGLAKTPPMGWNPYNAFSCVTTEVDYRNAADKLVSLGLKDLGYEYINLDCGWQGTQRNATGGFTWNTTTIPSGIPALSEYIHSHGLKFGFYSDGGYYACDFVGGTAYYLGSLGHETSDANSFADWGADYLKYDNCYSVSATDFVDYDPPIQIEPHYVTMRDALAATGRPIVFSACEWGVQDPARWPASNVANSWRISNDIGPPPSWDSLIRIINQVVPITGFAGPGGWNDLDMLEVGNNGLTDAEQQTHFAFWAATKSPLIISTDLTNISSTALKILSNRRIIALNQDPLGASISFKRRYTNDHDVWAGPLADRSTVALIINLEDASRSLTFNLEDVGMMSAEGMDLLTGAHLGRLHSSYTSTVPAHGSIVLKLSDAVTAPAPTFTYYAAAAPSSILGGDADTRVVNSSITVVGYVGLNGTLTLTGVDGGSSGGRKLLSVDYINGAFTFFNSDDCSNCRNAFFSVNGGSPVEVQMPISAQSWDILFEGFLLALDGFNTGTNNTIEISNPTSYAPDFYRVGVAV